LDPPAFLEQLERLTWHNDEPIQFANSPLLGALCLSAQDMGLKVLFSGEGVDEVLYGYERFSRTERLLDGIQDPDTKISYLYFGGGMHSVELVQQLTKGLADGPNSTSPWKWLESNLGRWDLRLLQMIFSQKFRLQMLMQRQDRIGMSSSVEIRSPFLAPWFMSWVNSLSIDAKVDPLTGSPKRILKDAMRAKLPSHILGKRKMGFPSDLDLWLQTPESAHYVQKLVNDSSGFSQAYLDGHVVGQILDDHASGRRRQDRLIWRFLTLELWHKVFSKGVAMPEAA